VQQTACLYSTDKAKKRCTTLNEWATTPLRPNNFQLFASDCIHGDGRYTMQIHKIRTVYDVLPYFATAGHRRYAKSAYNLLKNDEWASEHSPTHFQNFQNGVRCARRGDRFWAGLSTDGMIEQVLMRNVKMSYGLTQGKGLYEIERLIWLMSTTPCRPYSYWC